MIISDIFPFGLIVQQDIVNHLLPLSLLDLIVGFKDICFETLVGDGGEELAGERTTQVGISELIFNEDRDQLILELVVLDAGVNTG